MSPQTYLVPFHNRQIVTFNEGNKYFIALKTICENIGLQWAAQFNRLKRDEKFKSVISIMDTTGADKKKYKMVCLPLEVLPGWLYTIETSRIRNREARRLLRIYQQEATKVLYEHFFNRDDRLQQRYQSLKTEYKMLKDNFIVRFIQEKRDEYFKSNQRIFHQAQWYWRLYRYYKEDIQKVIDHVGLFSFTINRYTRRFQQYLYETREVRVLTSISRYDSWTAEDLAPAFDHAGIDFWEAFLRNDPILWEPHKYVIEFESANLIDAKSY
jgi:hypothetical protein